LFIIQPSTPPKLNHISYFDFNILSRASFPSDKGRQLQMPLTSVSLNPTQDFVWIFALDEAFHLNNRLVVLLRFQLMSGVMHTGAPKVFLNLKAGKSPYEPRHNKTKIMGLHPRSLIRIHAVRYQFLYLL
jgi:hypothetical protein